MFMCAVFAALFFLLASIATIAIAWVGSFTLGFCDTSVWPSRTFMALLGSQATIFQLYGAAAQKVAKLAY